MKGFINHACIEEKRRELKPKLLIDSNEFMNNILDSTTNEGYIDNLLISTVFADKPDCRAAFIHGMVIASMMTCECKPICVMVEDN